MTHSAAVAANPVAPPAVRQAAVCYAIVFVAALLFLILDGLLAGFSFRGSLTPLTGVFCSLYLWMSLPNGDRDARRWGLVFGALVVVYSAGAIIYGAVQVAAMDVPRPEATLLVDSLFVGPAITLVAAASAVILLMRRESREYFRMLRA